MLAKARRRVGVANANDATAPRRILSEEADTPSSQAYLWRAAMRYALRGGLWTRPLHFWHPDSSSARGVGALGEQDTRTTLS